MKTFLSARRVAVTAAASAAAIGAFALPSAASATDLGLQCSGSAKIEGLGSTFQNPVEEVWTGAKGGLGFNHGVNKLACQGTEIKLKKTKGKPTVVYNQEAANQGSGACLKDFGNKVTPEVNTFPFCGTDEAPSQSVEETMEGSGHLAAGADPREGTSNVEGGLESIPVLQGAVAVIVNLPSGCTATSDPKVGKEVKAFDRLSLSAEVIEEIYRGVITNWKQVQEKSGGSNVITCTVPAEKEDPIHVVVRADKSGTTHIFKSWLAQIDPSTKWEAEAFENIEVPTGSGNIEHPCSPEKPAAKELRTWEEVQEGCQNQRWPEAAHVIRPKEKGNPGTIKEVAAIESSIGYADLAVTREKKSFSEPGVGGEGTNKFWVLVSNSKDKTAASKQVFQDASTNGDTGQTPENSNCKSTKYVAKVGEKFPPAKTRDDWSKVKGEYNSSTYGICGLTYALAARQLYYWESPLGVTEAASLEKQQDVHDYLLWVLNTSTEGGGKEALLQDYYALPGSVKTISENGVKELKNKEA